MSDSKAKLPASPFSTAWSLSDEMYLYDSRIDDDETGDDRTASKKIFFESGWFTNRSQTALPTAGSCQLTGPRKGWIFFSGAI